MAFGRWVRKAAIGAAFIVATLGAWGGQVSAQTAPSMPSLADQVAAGRLDQSILDTMLATGKAEGFLVLTPRVAPAAPASIANYDGAKLRARAAGGSETTVVRNYDKLAVDLVRFNSPAALAKILADTQSVGAVRANRQNSASDAESGPLIRQPEAVAAGYTGAGYSVAVLDTGLEYTLSDFGSCTSVVPTPTPASCRVAYVQDFAQDDQSHDAAGNQHGTNVAGVIAGIATGAHLIGLDVFDGQFATDSDILAAINWVIGNRASYNIVAVNMSLGDGSHNTSTCSGSYTSAFANLLANGIAPVVAAGNSGFVGSFVDGIASPACTTGALSVGAVYDSNVGAKSWNSGCTDTTTAADQITCFSQTAPILSVLAPGSVITAAGISLSGTSQATPHVAAAFAVLAQASPTSTVDQRVTAITTTGPNITDTRPSPSITKHRLDLCAAVAAIGGACGTPVASKLAFTAQPSNGAPGIPLSGQPVVTVQSAGGATVTGDSSSVTLTLVGAGVLSCNGGLTKAAVNGVATFIGCAVSASGSYTIQATDGALTPATSNQFAISLPAHHLAFSAAPGSGGAGVAFPVQPAVVIQDAGNGTVAGATNSVTLSLTGGPGALSCTGGLTKAAVNGVASFAGCKISAAGAGYVLHAAASGLAGADSSSITVVGLPAAPTFAAPVVAPTTAQINWSDNASDESGYRVLKYTPGGWVQQGADLPAGTTTWSDSNLTPASYYAYWVQAFNAAGTAWTPSYLTVITSGLPIAPMPASAAGDSTTQITLSWIDNSSDETEFKVLRYNGSGWPVAGTVPAGQTSFTDSGLTPGATYAYWIVAANSAGWSYAPAYVAGSTFASAAGPTTPTYAGASVTTTSVTLHWNDASSGGSQEDGYRVLRQTPQGWVDVSGPGLLPADTTEFTDTGLTPGTYYGYWVLSEKNGGATYARTYLTAITSSLLPAAPAFSSATAQTSTSATLTWISHSADESGFRVLRYQGGSWSPVGEVGPGVTSFTEQGLQTGVTYAYWITAFSAAGSSYGSALISVATP